MKIGVVTDRLSDNLDTAMRMACEMGFDGVEIRSVGDRRVPCLSPEEVAKTGDILQKYPLPVWALSSGAFCCSLYDKDFSDQTALFTHALEPAVEWGVGAVVASGVRRHWKDRRGDYRRLIDALSPCLSDASARGVSVWLENNFGWYNDAPDNILRMQKVLSPLNVKTCWNLAGYYAAGAGEWTEFAAALGENLGCVHLSDVLMNATQRSHFPIESILEALNAGPDAPPVVLDGTGLPDPEKAAECLRRLRELCAGERV